MRKNKTEEISLEVNEKTAAKKRRRQNRETMIVSYFFVFIMLCIIGNIVYFEVTQSETVINNSYNTRQELLASQNIRGKILSKDRDILAETIVDASGNETRSYPYDNLFAHVVGYSTKGKTGIEAMANIHLLTSNAFIGEKIKNEMDASKNLGDNIVSTLDVLLQETAYRSLGVYAGSIIVSEPKTGKILAMVSKPDYDPNQIATIWEDVIEDESSSVLVNRSTQGLYPPGSTFKIITALEYFRENNGNIDNYTYNCNGSYMSSDGHKINCYHKTKHGHVDFRKAFEKSCNSSFVDIGLSLNLNTMTQTTNELLFNTQLPTSLVSNQSSYVLAEGAGQYDVMQTVIGQGKTQMTPLHLNLITCAIANEGEAMRPYVIDHIESYKGATVKQYSKTSAGNIVTADEAAFLKEIMVGVVEKGTATKLKGLSYTAAGKTGSAEYNAAKGESHAWFTGFAPAEDPQIAITIIVEGAGSGGDYAVPIAKRIFDAYFSKY